MCAATLRQPNISLVGLRLASIDWITSLMIQLMRCLCWMSIKRIQQRSETKMDLAVPHPPHSTGEYE